MVDGASSYGRGVLRGVMRYANLQRRWELHADLGRSADMTELWPDADGAIVAGAMRAVFDHIRARARHVVFCSGAGDPTETPVVALDDEAAGAMAAQHFMDCQLRQFAFYGASGGHNVAGKRFRGFCKALEERGFACHESELAWPTHAEWLSHAHWPRLIAWLRDLPKPIGIMAADDAVAHDLAGACLEANIGVPHHVAIIGVNNDDLLCEAAWPPLSSVEADYSRMGYQAAKTLDRLLAGEKLSAEERLFRLPPLGVVQRQSTSVLALNDPNLAAAVRFIRDHACDPCTVDDVLRHVPVNRRWLERQFVSTLGRTLHDEITRVRMDAARRLLLQPDLSMPEIAERCGYSAIQNFTRTFRITLGMTPGVYRRRSLRGTRPELV
jgi:LacI family transcriptional regulator